MALDRPRRRPPDAVGNGAVHPDPSGVRIKKLPAL